MADYSDPLTDVTLSGTVTLDNLVDQYGNPSTFEIEIRVASPNGHDVTKDLAQRMNLGALDAADDFDARLADRDDAEGD